MTNPQTQVSDGITKDRLGVASRFVQTLLKKLPGCVDTNPAKMAFSIAKVIIEIKDVGCCLYILGNTLTITTIYQAVGSNKDELAQCLEETANRLLAVERTVVGGVPKAAEEAMENLRSYVVFRLKGYHIIWNMSPSRILGKEMKELKDLADKSLTTRILDHEAHGLMIQQIFQRVKEATMSFFVRAIMFI